MTMYTRRKDQDIWHWRNDCPEFPTGNYIINRAYPPPAEAQCPKCSALTKHTINAKRSLSDSLSG
ncbi:MAG: hypothetical protein OEY09_11260 [Gammaproteobacteria bacterium]|nr:hypothetical protein [Gammaproteobacteria bacterium]